MRTQTISIFKFSELSEDAKQKAIENYREQNSECGYEWLVDEAMYTIKKGLDSFNCSLSNWSIDFQNANQSRYSIDFNIEYIDEIQNFTPQRLHKYLLNNFYDNFFTREHYGQYSKNEFGKWSYKRYSKILKVETDCPFTGVCYDCNFLDSFREFLKRPDNSDFEQLIKDSVYNVIRCVESEIEYQNEDEQIIEAIEANEYEFLESGEIA